MSRVGVIGYAQPANVELVAAWRAAGIDAALVAPRDALSELTVGDVAIGRLDVLQTLDGVEPGLETLDELETRGRRCRSTARRPCSPRTTSSSAMPAWRGRGIRRPPAYARGHRRGASALSVAARGEAALRQLGARRLPLQESGRARGVLAEIAGRGWFRKDGAVVQELCPPRGSTCA